MNASLQNIGISVISTYKTLGFTSKQPDKTLGFKSACKITEYNSLHKGAEALKIKKFQNPHIKLEGWGWVRRGFKGKRVQFLPPPQFSLKAILTVGLLTW